MLLRDARQLFIGSPMRFPRSSGVLLHPTSLPGGHGIGIITPKVEALRHEFGLPGMAILQFAFGNDPQAPTFKPHSYVRDLVAYTGTHDIDTVVGWWMSSGAGDGTRTTQDVVKEHAYARAYLGFKDDPIHWVLIRAILSSVANTTIAPMQDILGLGSEACMNLPGVPSGFWKWRMEPGAPAKKSPQDLRNWLHFTTVRLYSAQG